MSRSTTVLGRKIPVTDGLIDQIVVGMGDKSYRRLAAATEGRVSYGTVHRILSGKQKTMRVCTLVALALAIDADPEAMLARATEGPTAPTPWALPRHPFHHVPPDRRPRYERLLASLIKELEPSIPPADPQPGAGTH